jgi:4-hydroxybenzoate polyprenyltransferase
VVSSGNKSFLKQGGFLMGMHFLTHLIRLTRPQQWYKNLVIFIAVIFSTLALDVPLFLSAFLGFLVLCFASSGNYVLNDILDRASDRLHPEKKSRPIASGAISVPSALGVALVLYALAIWISVAYLTTHFLILVIVFILLTQAYSLLLKHIAFLDVIIISVNFVLRAVAGVLLLNHPTTPWLIICPFFLALLLAIGKRTSDIALLGAKAKSHRKVLESYTPNLTKNLLLIATTLLIMSYVLYSFSAAHPYAMILSIPFALYLVFHYLELIELNSPIVRHPELAIKDVRIVVGIVLWALVTLAVIYFPVLAKNLV